MKNAQWTDRFEGKWTDAELDQLIQIPARPIVLGHGSPEHDGEILRAELKRVFTSSTQVRALLRKICEIARSHAELHFSSAESTLRGIYNSHPWGTASLPSTCLTGLAGTGKSELLSALNRLLDAKISTDLGGVKDLQLVSAWFTSLRDGSGLNSLLKPYFPQAQILNSDENNGITETPKKDIKLPLLLAKARRMSWRDGVCLLVVDEFQFISQSAGANAKATTVLLQLLGIGPRLVFCSNFSLGHKLKRRNQEDRHRLMSSPLILEPEKRSSSDWKNLISECKKVVPNVFTFDVVGAEQIIHQYTFGIKRLVVELFVISYGIARLRGKNPEISLDDFRAAYRSVDYTIYREDVDILWRQKIQGKMIREDLWCPFDQTADPVVVPTVHDAIVNFQKRIEESLLDSSLTPSETAAWKEIEPDAEIPADRRNVIRLPRSNVTKESLLEASLLLDDLP